MTLIRPVVGYECLTGLEAAQLLAEFYAALNLFTNLFQSSAKLNSTMREGAGSRGRATRREQRCSSYYAPVRRQSV